MGLTRCITSFWCLQSWRSDVVVWTTTVLLSVIIIVLINSILNIILKLQKRRKYFHKMTFLADVWTYQCGKCGKDFKTKAERDQHMIGCGQEPKPNCRSRSSSPER